MHFEKSLKAVNIFQFYFCTVIPAEHKIIYAKKGKKSSFEIFVAQISV